MPTGTESQDHERRFAVAPNAAIRVYNLVGETRIEAWDRETVGRYDVVVVATDHAAIDWAGLAAWAPRIVDTRDAMRGHDASGRVWKA